MNIIEQDIELLQKKLEQEFEKYEIEEESLQEKKNEVQEARIMNSQVYLNRYIAHSEGRQRAYKKFTVSRFELFNKKNKHHAGQLQAYQKVLESFKQIQGLV